jgi:hypothetical protein
LQRLAITITDAIKAIWLKWWSEANTIKPNHNVGMYIGVLAALGIAGTITVCVACWYVHL